jgi:hypothetical protein
MLPEVDTSEEQRLLQEGIQLFEQQDDADARILFLRVAALQGRSRPDAESYLTRIEQRVDHLPFAEGLHLLALGRWEVAKKRFEQVVQFNRDRRAAAEEHLRSIAVEHKAKKPDLQLFSEPQMAPPKPTSRPASETLIRRTPHLEATPLPLKPGESCQISVYADTAPPRPGEKVEEVALDIAVASVRVRLLVSGHLVVEGEQVRTIMIERSQDRSDTISFGVKLKSRSDLELAGLVGSSAEAVALFEYEGRPSGRVSVVLPTSFSSDRAIQSAAPVNPPSGSLRVNSGAIPADLTVTIVSSRANDGRQFWCTVQTPLLSKYADGISGEWNLPNTAFDIVNNYMANFTKKGACATERIAALRGAGKQLFRAAPDVFKKAFWELIDSGSPLKYIAIVSEEPYVPWELMIPRRTLDGGIPQTLSALGVGFAVGRWTSKDVATAQQRISMTDSYVIAPKYPPNRALPHAQDEAAYVMARFPGKPIEPVDFENIVRMFKAGGKTLVHFACHGSSGVAGKQVIELENSKTLLSDVLLGVQEVETALREKQSFVFLNACEVGRGTPALSGVGGFAESFIDMGASAVVAPLWSVKDGIAHEIALKFYDETLKNPQLSFAEILTGIRARAYDPQIGEDTYAAYCFYGDPLATRRSAP